MLDLSSSQYVHDVVNNFEEYLNKQNDKCWNFPEKGETPLITSYHHELDISQKLHPTEAAHYMPLIGILRFCGTQKNRHFS